MAMRFGCPPLRRRRSGYAVVLCPLPPQNLRSVAYHEAGHAALQGALGYRVTRCFATDTEGISEASYPGAEHARIENMGLNKFPLQLEQDLACWLAATSFAGIQAEMLMYGLPFKGMFQRQDSDTEHANQCLMRVFTSDSDRESAAGYSQELARAALMHLWPAVEVIAETLIAHGEIDNDGVVAALSLVEDVEEIGRVFAMEASWQCSPETMGEALVT